MSKKITKQFSFDAPEKNNDFKSNAKKTVNSVYRGASDIWIYVDTNTGLNPQFVSTGDLPDPTNTWRHRSVLLDAENSNHILLMDLLSGSTAHESVEITEIFNQPGDVSLNPQVVFSYTSKEHPSAIEVFDIANTRVDEKGVVHYEWKKTADGLTKEDLLETIRVHKLKTEELLRDPIIFANLSAKETYEKFIAILDYIKDDLIERVEPWKIAIPQLHEI